MEIDLAAANSALRPMSAEDRLCWGVEQFGLDMVTLSSMQKTASVIMHMFYRLSLENEVIFGDTGYHFHETLKLRDQYMRDYKLNIVTVYSDLTPEQQENHYGKKLYLYVDGQPECCRIRKEEPFLAHMRKHQRRCVVNGLRTAEGGKRGDIDPIRRDPRIKGFSLHPIFDWTNEDVAEYIKRHELPIHPLHDQGFPSIGCECCTTPVGPGEDERAGRWRHLRGEDGKGPMYCGINFTDGSGI